MVQMGVLQNSKSHALLMLDSTNAQDKGKRNGKDPKEYDSKSKEIYKYFEGVLGSKRKKNFENKKWRYCMMGFHLEFHCMQNKIN